MNALVISNSLVVLELFKMAMHKKNIEAEYANSANKAKNDSYRAIFIDDAIMNFDKEIDFIKDNFDFSELIIIGKSEDDNASYSLKKPFLTNDIEEILDEIKENSSDLEIGSVLDLNEIEKIKALMELADNEKDKKINYKDKLKNREDIKIKSKNAKKFLKELCKMDKKELKKILKKAKVKIEISFKDSNE